MNRLLLSIVFLLSVSFTFAQLKVDNVEGLATNRKNKAPKITSRTSTIVSPQSVDYWTGSATSSAKTQVSLINGYDTEDGWVKFDISSIPDNVLVTSLVFHGYVNETNWPYWSITPLPLDPVTTDAATLISTITANEVENLAYSYNNEGSSFSTGWKEYVLGGTAVEDFQAALTNDWFAVGIASRDNSTTYYVKLDGWDETNPPYLEVFYDVLLTNDMAVISVDIPPAVGPTLITPKATVKSLSDQTATFNVTMTITGGTPYTSTKTVTNLASLETQQVSFDDWIPQMGVTYTVNVCTEMAGDPNPDNNCMEMEVLVVDVELSYIYIAYDPTSTLPEGPGSFNLPDPSVMTSLGSTTSAQFISGGTWRKDLPNGDSYWYAIEYYDASTGSGGNLYTINPATGAMTLIGNAGLTVNLNGLAYDHTTGNLYAVSGSDLYTLNTTTGAATLVGALGSSTFINLACSPDGELYSVNITNDNLYKVDKITGTATLIGPIGFDASYAQDMEFNLEDGSLYMAAYNIDNNDGTGELRLVNTTDGSTIFLGEFQYGAEICGFGIPYNVVPVELTSFTASVVDNGVVLNWKTATETNNYGFEIERKSNGVYDKIGFVNGFGTTTEPKNYTFADTELADGNYTYRLKQIDYDGSFSYSNEVNVDYTSPKEFGLSQNYPNPFNPVTRIEFSLAVDSKVTLTVFNILGEKVATLVNGNLPAGVQNINFDASNLNSGVYFYRIDAAGIDGQSFSKTMKMILTK